MLRLVRLELDAEAEALRDDARKAEGGLSIEVFLVSIRLVPVFCVTLSLGCLVPEMHPSTGPWARSRFQMPITEAATNHPMVAINCLITAYDPRRRYHLSKRSLLRNLSL